MKDKDKYKHISKFLSLVLRHRPEAIGLGLDDNGWANIDELLEKSGKGWTRGQIEETVKHNDKQRFALSDDGQMIRANQGHSVNIDLGFTPTTPPEYLYHGTATKFIDSIMRQGLLPRSRQHVHVSADTDTATQVGKRHGKLVILRIPALAMHQAGHVFFQATNGVWLTEHVPPDDLETL